MTSKLCIFPFYISYFFRVKVTNVIVDELSLMFNRDAEPYFPFYWQSNPLRFISFDEDLMTLAERVEKTILEQLPA